MTDPRPFPRDREPRATVRGAHDGLDRAILVALRDMGASAPDRLATRFGASRASVLQRLRSLESRGSVIRQAIRHGVGRPRHLYDVTAEAQRSLPANYGGLATTLLESIAELGGDQLVDAVFQARRRLLAEQIRARITAALGRPPPSPHASGSWPSSRTSRAISAAPRHSTGSMGRWSCARRTAPSSARSAARPPAGPRSSCSRRSSTPGSRGSRTSPRAIDHARTGSSRARPELRGT